MNSDDLPAIEALMRRVSPAPTDVTLLSGEGQETSLVGSVWGVNASVCGKPNWDIRVEPPGDMTGRDLVMACNTFMCAADPGLWLRNIAMAFRRLIVQDLAVAQRTPTLHCDPPTGDVARYSVSEHGVIGVTDPGLSVFDFSTCGYPVLDCEPYAGGGKFVVLLNLRPTVIPFRSEF